MAQETTVYNGRYELVRRIARGGMAEVFLARDLLLDRPVALKVLFPELSIDRAFVERFRREAQAAANLTHPNIVSVYDWGEEAGTYFIVMEYVDGRPLSHIIKTEGALLPDRAASIAADVAAALAHAHRNGVVHRDVKPGNVLIDARTGQVKVTDFGIARAANAEENLTQTGAVMGTAVYFSPEQAQGYGVDPRSDVYSLGVVLYEMVTGRPPFEGDNPVAIAYKHVREQPLPPRELNPAVSPAFEAIVLKALAKDPKARYPSADDLRADLIRFRQGRPVVATPPASGLADPATEAIPVATAAATQAIPATRVQAAYQQGAPAAGTVLPAPEPVHRRTGAYVVLLFVMLGALLVLLYLLARQVGVIGGDSGTAQVAVPRVLGATVEEAERLLTEQGFKITREFGPNEAEQNTVYDQDPDAGTKVDRGSTVKIFVSQGEAPVEVPNVVGENVDDARSFLKQSGFEVTTVPQPDDRAPEGEVLEQDPKAGEEVPRGSTVTLTVSSGPAEARVPNVIGLTEDEAVQSLREAGFGTIRVLEQTTTDKDDDGRVVRQEPAPNSSAKSTDRITIYLGRYEEPSTTTSTTSTTTTTVIPGRRTTTTTTSTTSTTEG